MGDSNSAAPPPDPANDQLVSVDSGWPRPNSDGAADYFIEEDFRWNLDQYTMREAINIEPSGRSAAAAGSCSSLARSSSDCGGGGLNPSVSSSSSEDPAEKSTGGRAPEIIAPSKAARKKCQKRIRQPRFAFVTKSEVDHLEDGYRWRKYGQKAVKNSPFPRSYYRCTNSKCTVKKRVERSSEDPTTVITTYEGQHCHHAVGFHRAGFISHESLLAAGQFSPFYYAGGVHDQLHGEVAPSIPQYSQQQATNSSDVGSGSQMLPHQMQQPDPTEHEGLLGDMVPPGMRIVYR